MVYLIEKCKVERSNILSQENIQSAFYRYYTKQSIDFNLAGMEELALRGYKKSFLSPEEIDVVVQNKNKRNQVSNNIFKLIGIYLASSNDIEIEKILKAKFESLPLEGKFLLAQVFPNLFSSDFIRALANSDNIVLKHINGQEVDKEEFDQALVQLVSSTTGIQELLIFEEVLRHDLSSKYNDLTSIEVVRQVLNNFSEAIKKIKTRRRGKDVFEFKDEYDVQDVLYVMLKPIFPKLKEEDPVPKVGSNSTRIDLILRDQKILIEVKMIKESDKDESKFIKQLKEDIQSYYSSEWMDHLFCFVYDPLDKTKDRQSFYDLNGTQTISNKTFEVEVIVEK